VPAGFEVKRAMGEWLEGLRPWQCFSTWTFAQPVTVPGAMHQAREHVHRLENLVNGWELSLPCKRNGWGYVEEPQLNTLRKRVHAFVGVEEGGVGGLVHLHALVDGVDSLKGYCGVRLALPDQVRQGRPMSYSDQVHQRMTPIRRRDAGRTTCRWLHSVGPPGTPRWPVLSCCMVHAWPRGMARVFPYDPSKGAAYYVAKYITKRLAEWELLGFAAATSS